MAHTLESLVDRLQADGVEAGREAAERIRLRASEEAEQLRADAQATATQMISEATAHTERLRALRRDALSDLAAIRARLEIVPSDVDEEPLPASPIGREDQSLSSSDE